MYLTWGIVGFLFLGDPGVDLAGRDTNHGALGLETNGLQNFAHVALGLVALACTTNETAMRVGGTVVVIVGAVLAAAGVLGMVRPEANIFSENLAVTLVHAATGVVGLVIALAPMPTRGQRHGLPEGGGPVGDAAKALRSRLGDSASRDSA